MKEKIFNDNRTFTAFGQAMFEILFELAKENDNTPLSESIHNVLHALQYYRIEGIWDSKLEKIYWLKNMEL